MLIIILNYMPVMQSNFTKTNQKNILLKYLKYIIEIVKQNIKCKSYGMSMHMSFESKFLGSR